MRKSGKMKNGNNGHQAEREKEREREREIQSPYNAISIKIINNQIIEFHNMNQLFIFTSICVEIHQILLLVGHW